MYVQVPAHLLPPVLPALRRQLAKEACSDTKAIAKSQGVRIDSCKAVMVVIEGNKAAIGLVQTSEGKTFRVLVELTYGWNITNYSVK